MCSAHDLDQAANADRDRHGGRYSDHRCTITRRVRYRELCRMWRLDPAPPARDGAECDPLRGVSARLGNFALNGSASEVDLIRNRGQRLYRREVSCICRYAGSCTRRVAVVFVSPSGNRRDVS